MVLTLVLNSSHDERKNLVWGWVWWLDLVYRAYTNFADFKQFLFKQQHTYVHYQCLFAGFGCGSFGVFLRLMCQNVLGE